MRRQPWAAPSTVTADADGRAASKPQPGPAPVIELPPAQGDRQAPTPHRALAGGSIGQLANAKRQVGDGQHAEESALARRLAPLSEPAADTSDPQRQRGLDRPDPLPPAPRDGVAAMAPSGIWRPDPAPAGVEKAGARTEALAPGRRAGTAVDLIGAGPHRAARPGPVGPAALDGQAAATVPTAPGQPAGTAAQRFDSALQSVLDQRTAPPGTATEVERAAKAPLARQIEARVDSPLFAPALGSQLSLLARDGVKSALLQLHPAEMGPISVQIALDGNAVRIDFQALRADTRGFIEASLPALAGALQDAGLTLAGGGVFEQAPGRQPQPQPQAQPQPQPQAEAGQGARQAATAHSGPAGQPDSAPSARRTAPRGLVDLVA